MAPPTRLSLPELAAKLAVNGPTKQEPSNRRVRAVLDGHWLFDSVDTVYVWEHPYYPVIYVPLRALTTGPAEVSKDKTDERGFWTGSLQLHGRCVEVAGFDKGPLEGLVKIPADSLDSWFAEDEKLLGSHPKDPYKRIECLPSSREVRIEVDGTVVARSTNNVFLHETMLRTRFYLPATSVLDWTVLTPSDTSTFCPYKGKASYYHLKVGNRVLEDAVWSYTYPTLESAAIQARLCFYNEKVDVYIDGEKEVK